jgi:probable rRNA maturation factor
MASVHAISVLIVSDRRMAALHQKFCGTSGPTDVLTFQHGEIVISVETAMRQAKVFRSTLAGEIRLYLLHGLLHLGGFNDIAARERRQMLQLQEKLLATALCTNR